MKSSKKLLPFLAAIAACSISAASAAISVVDTAVFGEGTGSTGQVANKTFTDTQFGGLDFTGSSKLVISITLKSNEFKENQPVAVTYGGVAMTVATSGYSGVNASAWSGIFYLDNPTGAGDLVITPTPDASENRRAYAWVASAMTLSGTAAGVGNTVAVNPGSGAGTNPATGTVSASAGSLVVAAFGDGGFNSNIQAFTSPENELLRWANYTGSAQVGTASHAHGYEIVDEAANFTASFSSNTGDRRFLTVAEFSVIPEPSTALLGGLGMLFLLRRRRA